MRQGVLGAGFCGWGKPMRQARDTRLDAVGNRDTALVLGRGVT